MQVNQNYQSPAFSGQIIFKPNKKQNEIVRALFINPALQKLTRNGYDVVISSSSQKVSKYNWYHDPGTTIYKLLIKIRKENSFIEKIKCALGLTPKTYLSSRYHSDFENSELIKKRIDNNFIKDKLKIRL